MGSGGWRIKRAFSLSCSRKYSAVLKRKSFEIQSFYIQPKYQDKCYIELLDNYLRLVYVYLYAIKMENTKFPQINYLES